jgi:very-short-patch-repair endonuclease
MRRRRREPVAAGAATGVDAAIARLATEQDGVVGRAQLIGLGLGSAAVDHRVRGGRLIVIHRGVYAVGHAALPDRGRLRAARMAAGANAVLSHRTAAAMWGLIPALPPIIEVTVTRKGPRTRPGLIVHETRHPPEIRLRGSLPLTAPLRTLADLKFSAPLAELERLCAEALVAGLVTQPELDAARLLPAGPAAPTRSELERLFLRLVRDAGLPRPLVNRYIGRYMADFAWPAERVIVETDGYAAHGHRAAFERDHARDADLVARGWIVLRFTWRQLRFERVRVATRLAQTLARRDTSTPVTRGAGGGDRR